MELQLKGTSCSDVANLTNLHMTLSTSDGIVQLSHEVFGVNSIDLTAITTYSDDNEIPLTTNSSISSGDSFTVGIAKLEAGVSFSKVLCILI